MISKKAFYEKCLKLGYTDINDSEQHKQIELMAMELNIDYEDIDEYYNDAKLVYLADKAVEDETNKKKNEEKRKKAINGKLLYQVTTRFGVWKVYKRPDESIYCEDKKNAQGRLEGISFFVEDHYHSYYKYNPTKTIYTAASVGGVTTGGVDQIPGGYEFRTSKTNKALVKVKIGNRDPEIVVVVKLSEWGTFLYGDQYPEGRIVCLDTSAYTRNNDLRKYNKSGNMYEQINQSTAELDLEAYPKSTCISACDFINWYTENTIPYEKSDAAEIYDIANDLSKSRTENDLTLASKYYLFIKDYEDAADKAIATRREIQSIKQEQKLEQEKREKALAEENRIKAEQRRLKWEQTKKRLIKFFIFSAIAVVLCIAIVTFVVPAVKYSIATNKMNAGDYSRACEIYESLDNYRDSKSQATICSSYIRYNQGVVCLESNQFDEAEEIFTSLGSFNDSDSMVGTVQEARNNYNYEMADSYLASNDFDAAEEFFRNLGDYSDAESRVYDVIEARNSYTYDQADNLYISGQIEDAYELFDELGNYSDSENRAIVCALDIAEEAVNNNNRDRAIQWYKTAGDYESAYSIEYSYVQDHFDNTDITTYHYLEELADADYLDSSDLYDSLYEIVWYVVINGDYSDRTNNVDTLPYEWLQTEAWVHISFEGGYPGQSIEVSVLHEVRRRSVDDTISDWNEANNHNPYTETFTLSSGEWETSNIGDNYGSHVEYHRYTLRADGVLVGEYILHTPYGGVGS